MAEQQQQEQQGGEQQAPQAQIPQRGPVMTLRFNGGAPPPHPPCMDPTPDEEYQQHQANKSEQQQQRELSRQQDLETKEKEKKGSSFFKIAKLASNVASAVGKTAENLHSGAEDTVRARSAKSNEDRFAHNFPELVSAGETLICDFKCRVLSQGQSHHGHFMLSNKFLCFSGDTIRDIIPLNEIASIQRSVALDTIDNGPPFILPIPAPHVQPDTLQVFTVKQQVFQFLSFESTLAKVGSSMTTSIKGKPVDRAYNFVDHTWRRAAQVPLPGFNYAQY